MEVASTNWINKIDNKNESENNKQHGLMLDEVREAMQDLAYLVSMNNSGVENAAITSTAKPDSSSSEKTPSVKLEQADTSAEDVKDYTVNLLLEIEDAQSLEELDEIYKRFSSKAAKLRSKISLLKSREIIEAYLTLLSTLKMLHKQLKLARTQKDFQIENIKKIAENIITKLTANQQNLRLATDLSLRNAQNINNINLLQQLKAAEAAIQSQLKQQQEKSPNETNLLQQRLSKMLEQVQKAQETMQRQKLSADQINVLSKNIANIQNQLQQMAKLLTQQLKEANNPARQAALRQQIDAINALNAKLAELTRTLNIQQRLNQVQANQSTARHHEVPANLNLQQSRLSNVAELGSQRLSLSQLPDYLARQNTSPTALTPNNQSAVNPAAQQESIRQSFIQQQVRQQQVVEQQQRVSTTQQQQVTQQAQQQVARQQRMALTAQQQTTPQIQQHVVQQQTAQQQVTQQNKQAPTFNSPPKPEITTPCNGCGGGKSCCGIGKIDFMELAKGTQPTVADKFIGFAEKIGIKSEIVTSVMDKLGIQTGKATDDIAKQLHQVADANKTSKIDNERTDLITKNLQNFGDQLKPPAHVPGETPTQTEKPDSAQNFTPAKVVFAKDFVAPPPQSISVGQG